MSKLYICPSCGEEVETTHDICPVCGDEIKVASKENIEMDIFDEEVTDEFELEEMNGEESEVSINGIPSSKE